MAVYRGACQCGAISFHLETRVKREHWPVRMCQCDYCRSQRVGHTQPPFGRVRFDHSPEHIKRYHHGLFPTDFLVCPHCGIYVGSIMRERNGSFVVLNLAALGESEDCAHPPAGEWTAVVTVI